MDHFMFDDNLVGQSPVRYFQMPVLYETESYEEQLLTFCQYSENKIQVKIGDTQNIQKKPIKMIKRTRLQKNKRKQLKQKKISKKFAKKQGKNFSNSDYRKNICGYVTKKIMKQFVSQNYLKKVQELCQEHHVDREQVTNFYVTKIQRITGPSHIPPLVTPKSKDQIPIMKVFLKFFSWFLRQRYARHLFLQGKMEHKKAYIEYKNRQLAPLITQLLKQLEKDTQNLSSLNIIFDSNTNI